MKRKKRMKKNPPLTNAQIKRLGSQCVELLALKAIRKAYRHYQVISEEYEYQFFQGIIKTVGKTLPDDLNRAQRIALQKFLESVILDSQG